MKNDLRAEKVWEDTARKSSPDLMVWFSTRECQRLELSLKLSVDHFAHYMVCCEFDLPGDAVDSVRGDFLGVSAL